MRSLRGPSGGADGPLGCVQMGGSWRASAAALAAVAPGGAATPAPAAGDASSAAAGWASAADGSSAGTCSAFRAACGARWQGRVRQVSPSLAGRRLRHATPPPATGSRPGTRQQLGWQPDVAAQPTPRPQPAGAVDAAACLLTCCSCVACGPTARASLCPPTSRSPAACCCGLSRLTSCACCCGLRAAVSSLAGRGLCCRLRAAVVRTTAVIRLSDPCALRDGGGEAGQPGGRGEPARGHQAGGGLPRHHPGGLRSRTRKGGQTTP